MLLLCSPASTAATDVSSEDTVQVVSARCPQAPGVVAVPIGSYAQVEWGTVLELARAAVTSNTTSQPCAARQRGPANMGEVLDLPVVISIPVRRRQLLL